MLQNLMSKPVRSFLPRFLFVSEGSDAAERGEPSTSNPYPLETLQHRYWLDGWTAGHDSRAGAAARAPFDGFPGGRAKGLAGA